MTDLTSEDALHEQILERIACKRLDAECSAMQEENALLRWLLAEVGHHEQRTERTEWAVHYGDDGKVGWIPGVVTMRHAAEYMNPEYGDTLVQRTVLVGPWVSPLSGGEG